MADVVDELYCDCECHGEPALRDDAIAAVTACLRCTARHRFPRDPRDRVEPTVWEDPEPR